MQHSDPITYCQNENRPLFISIHGKVMAVHRNTDKETAVVNMMVLQSVYVTPVTSVLSI